MSRPRQPGAPPSPPRARVLEAVAQALSAHAPDAAGQVLVVAVSGGIDSMVLLDALWRLSPRLRTRLHVAHLDHQLRDAAAADRCLFEAYAASLGLPVTGGAADVRALAAAAGRSLEDAARQARYAFLDQVAAAVGSRYVVLGHQAGDQAETVLLHLLRGSGATGLAGMRPVRSGRYLRPLLQVSREQIAGYAAAAGVPFRQDRSNDDVRFARNLASMDLGFEEPWVGVIPHSDGNHAPEGCRTKADDFCPGCPGSPH